MTDPLLHSRIFNTPHLITPEKLQAICFAVSEKLNLSVEEPQGDVMKPAASVGRWENRDGRSGMLIDGGIGIIPITGTLVNRGTWIGTSSGLQSYDGIAQQLRMAAEDPRIKAILLDLNSFGGEASGVADLAQEIRDLSARKRVVALASDAALSAAYWIAAAASEVVVTETGLAGSIGVVLTHQDVTGRAEQLGIKITHIYAGSEKIVGTPFRALSDSDVEKLQAEVDQLYDLFSNRIDAYRAGKADAKGTSARVYRGQKAVDAGLADRVMSGRALLAEMQKAVTKGRSSMTDEKLYAESEVQDRINAAVDKKAAELNQQHADATADAVKTAITGERERISQITAMTEPGFEAERNEAIKTGASAPEFAMSVLQASRDRGVTLAGLRAGAPGAVAHAAAPEGNADGSKPWADVVGASPSKM